VSLLKEDLENLSFAIWKRQVVEGQSFGTVKEEFENLSLHCPTQMQTIFQTGVDGHMHLFSPTFEDRTRYAFIALPFLLLFSILSYTSNKILWCLCKPYYFFLSLFSNKPIFMDYL